ncbi:MAG: DUF2252 family protein [Labilithrix sp.]
MAKTKGLDVGVLARDLAEEQMKKDEARTALFPMLLRRKMERMSASPLAFLRGSAPLFYELLKANDDLGHGPTGEGWIVGDLHIENFGAYRPDGFDDSDKPTDKSSAKRPAVFDLNDFDDTIIGPWRYDVLRFSTSLLLAGREMGVTGPVVLELLDRVLDAWTHAVFDGEDPATTPAVVAALVEKVRARSKAQLLDARTKEEKGKRHLVRGPRYMDLAPDLLEQVPKALEEYISSIREEEKPPKGEQKVEDAAFRIAGTGSLGGLRMAVIVEGSKAIFDLKEQGSPSTAILCGEPEMDHAERVVTGFRACVVHPASMLGTSHIKLEKKKVSLSCRRLSPQEDKLDLPKLKKEDLPELATHLGALLGSAHRRGAKTKGSRWNKGDRETVRSQAIALAGLHEAVYLALCERMRSL